MLIEGEVGVGYVLCKGLDILLLMFIVDEFELLVVGMCFVCVFVGDWLVIGV